MFERMPYVFYVLPPTTTPWLPSLPSRFYRSSFQQCVHIFLCLSIYLSIYLQLLYHFLFTLNFIFTLTSWHVLSAVQSVVTVLKFSSIIFFVVVATIFFCSLLFLSLSYSLCIFIHSLKKHEDLAHRLCTNDDSLTLFHCICSAFSFMGVNI